MKYIKILIGLFLMIIALLLIDILTGIFYWNRSNLIFDASTFNNISTPIIASVSFLVYSAALFFTIKQNKIILSQHLRPYYEREIDRTINELEKEKINTDLIETNGKEYNAINYPNLILKLLNQLTENNEYLKDISALEKGVKFTHEQIKGRSYYSIVVFLSQFTDGLFNKFKYDYLKEIIQEIDNAKLLEEDKDLLKKRIKKEILLTYLSFIEFEKESSIHIPPIPYINNFPWQDNIDFKKISESNFKEYYDWFKTKLG